MAATEDGAVRVQHINFKWDIEQFSEKTERFLESKTFSGPSNKTHWTLLIFPNGNSETNRRSISLFLKLSSISPTRVIYCKLQIVCPVLENFKNTKVNEFNNTTLSVDTRDFGFAKFVDREECLRFLNNDKLEIGCELSYAESLEVDLGSQLFISQQEKLFCAGDYNDCTLICSDKEVSACKFLLACRSPIFRAIFIGDSEESKAGRVKVNDIRGDVIKELALFTVCGKIDNYHLVEELLVAADKYEIDELKNICTMKLIETLKKENVCRRLVIADRHNIDSLKKAAILFLKVNKINANELPDFKYLIVPEHQDMVIEIISAISATL